MNSMAKRLLFISLILSILITAIAYVYLNKLNTPNKVEEYTNVIIAATNIPKGTLIDRKMLKELKLPKDSVQQGYIKDYTLVVGKITKENILKDEIIIIDKLQTEKINELSFIIDENHRAVSVNVTGDTGVSYLLKPGDYVDIIVSLSEKKRMVGL
ncbi:Flp pilus assembly protein CpaB [Caloramator sp. mosi_1]|uniref:Flp pilus assembly protein CpaB n=1 Tax=Caloramator sp. mosi_1 TaxID=3023090 RepID=UPI00235F5A3E|nr:Flp pilus assembly protein CpaB [Caloramator sp. mosi_1]WDC84540.1 Flp pilus assembly protein CpaB [Caloramator sp. mosi_1]